MRTILICLYSLFLLQCARFTKKPEPPPPAVPGRNHLLELSAHVRESEKLKDRLIDLAALMSVPAGQKGLYSPAQEERILGEWSHFLFINNQLIRIHSTYKDFHRLNGTERQLAFSSFLLAGLTFYRNSLLVTRLFEKNKTARAKLNEESIPFGIEEHSFNVLYGIAADARNFKQAVTGLELYMGGREELQTNTMLSQTIPDLEKRIEKLPLEIALLHREMPGTAQLQMPVDSILKVVRKPFYAIQSGISMFFGHTKSPTAEKVFNTRAVQNIESYLQPGDVLITRSSGYISNLFLPGFWKHAILYAGKEGDLSTLHADESIAKKIKEYVRSGSRPGKETGFTVEAVGEGVVVSDLATSLTSNYVVVLRPSGLSAAERLDAVRRAHHFLGTPYDFDFDFSTTASIVCTELIYQVYGRLGGKFSFPVSTIAGRRVVAPNTFVQKGLGGDRGGLPPEAFELILIARSAGNAGGLKWLHGPHTAEILKKTSESIKNLYITDLD